MVQLCPSSGMTVGVLNKLMIKKRKNAKFQMNQNTNKMKKLKRLQMIKWTGTTSTEFYRLLNLLNRF